MEKPSENSEKMWIRTENQLTEAEKKQKKITPGKIRKFLEEKDFSNFMVRKYEGPMYIPFAEKNKPLKLGEETIDEMANELELKTGKWIIPVKENEVDEAWNSIKQLCNKDKKISAKVATKKNFEPNKRASYVICVYTDNYENEEEVMRVRSLLEEVGFEETIYYKPDIYTMLGIYSSTALKFGLDGASIYKS